MASKYDPLGEFLARCETTEAPMSFAEIEKVIGAPLPPKAVNHPAWWSNNTSNNTMTKVWLDAGYRSERVDVAARRLVFRRVGAPSRRKPERYSSPEPAGFLTRLRDGMQGTVHVPKGVDLTAPMDEAWDADQP